MKQAVLNNVRVKSNVYNKARNQNDKYYLTIIIASDIL